MRRCDSKLQFLFPQHLEAIHTRRDVTLEEFEHSSTRVLDVHSAQQAACWRNASTALKYLQLMTGRATLQGSRLLN
jgi:hypothetical protein